jgi:hypothetical protein
MASLPSQAPPTPAFRDVAFLRGHARDHCLAFWARSAKPPSGGLYHCLKDDGSVYDARTRHLVSSTRLVVQFAWAIIHDLPVLPAPAPSWRDLLDRCVCVWVSLPLSCTFGTCMHAPSRAQWHPPAPNLDPRRAQQYDDLNFLIQAWCQYVASTCMQKCHGHKLPVGASRPLCDTLSYSASDQSLPMPFATARTEGLPVPHGQPLLVTSEQCCPLLSTADMVTQKLTCT